MPVPIVLDSDRLSGSQDAIILMGLIEWTEALKAEHRTVLALPSSSELKFLPFGL